MSDETLSKAELALIDKIIGALGLSSLHNLLWKKVEQAFRFTFKNTQVNYGFTHATPDPLALEYLGERVFILSDKTWDRLTGDLRWELLEGIRNTESISDIKKRLDGIFTGMHDYEIERIARTETLNAMAEGRFQANVQSGVANYKQWKAAMNNKRTAADSKRLNGQIQEIGDPFVDPKTGDTCMHNPNRPNCRCTVLYLRKLPPNIIYKGGQRYNADEIQKIEFDIGSLTKTEKRIWVKPAANRKGHYRKIKGAKKEVETLEKPYAYWKPGMERPVGLIEGAYADMGDGEKLKIAEIVAPDFVCDKGNWYEIKNISKIIPGEAPKEKAYENEATDFFNKYKETEQGRKDLEIVYHYSSSGYRRINPYLISGELIHATEDELKVMIDNLKKIINKAPKYEGKVFRGMRFENKVEFDNFLSECKLGQTLLMKNFVSTSTDKDIASEFSARSESSYSISFIIKSKKGVFLDGASANSREKEVLFNHESEFKISDIKKISDSKFEVTMEEV